MKKSYQQSLDKDRAVLQEKYTEQCQILNQTKATLLLDIDKERGQINKFKVDK